MAGRGEEREILTTSELLEALKQLPLCERLTAVLENKKNGTPIEENMDSILNLLLPRAEKREHVYVEDGDSAVVSPFSL